LTDDGSKVRIDLDLKDDSDKGIGNLIIYHDDKKVFDLFHYDNSQDEKDGYSGNFQELDFVKLRNDGKTEILLSVHMSSDGGLIHLIEWDGDKFSETLTCSDRYELKDLDGDGEKEIITFDRYSAGGPSIYSYDYSQRKYVLSTYEYPDYLKQYAQELEQGKEAERQAIVKYFSQGGGYTTFRAENLFQIYYMLDEHENLRKDFQFFYEEFPKARWDRSKTPKPVWNSLPSEEVDAQRYLDGSQKRNFNHSVVEKYRVLLGLRTLAQTNIDRAKSFYHQKKYEEAINEYQKAITIAPDYWEAYGLMGYSYLKNHQVDKAVANLEKSIEIDPAYAMGHYNLALAYWAGGQKDKALEQVKKSIKVDKSLKIKIAEDPQFKVFENETKFREMMKLKS